MTGSIGGSGLIPVGIRTDATIPCDHDARSEDAAIARSPTLSRRFLMTGAGGAALAGEASASPSGDRNKVQGASTTETLSVAGPDAFLIALDVNGRRHDLVVEPRVTLLDALRERLGLTGTKKGCGQGTCGACTVLVDGRRVNSCLTLAVMTQGRPVVTVEGLPGLLGLPEGALHPVQAAFVRHDGYQCGYCTPGQVVSAVALLSEGHAGSDEEIREWMSGNLCRCGAYANIVAAVRDASGRSDPA